MKKYMQYSWVFVILGVVLFIERASWLFGVIRTSGGVESMAVQIAAATAVAVLAGQVVITVLVNEVYKRLNPILRLRMLVGKVNGRRATSGQQQRNKGAALRQKQES